MTIKAIDVADYILQKQNTMSAIEYLLNVLSDPLPDDKAHALIVPTPQYRSENNFKKIKERLAKLAKWELKPTD